MLLLLTVLGVFGTTTLAALFTDTQWADVQSFLNFAVLLLLVHRQERRVPQKTAELTREEIETAVSDNGGPHGLRDDLAELVVEAIERRYRSK